MQCSTAISTTPVNNNKGPLSGPFKRTNKMIKSDKLLEQIAKPIWNKYQGIYSELKSFEMPVLRFDGRIKVLAYSYHELNLIRVSRAWWPNNIELYKSDIIPHELAHQIVFNLYGEVDDPHGFIWQTVMLDFGINPLITYEVK